MFPSAWNMRVRGSRFSVSQRIRRCIKSLSSWNKTQTSNARDKILHSLEMVLEIEKSSSYPRSSNVKALMKIWLLLIRTKKITGSQEAETVGLKLET